MAETKQCPYCGETIMADANKCRYCKEWLPVMTAQSNKNDKGSSSLFRQCFWEQFAHHFFDYKGSVDRKTYWVNCLFTSLICFDMFEVLLLLIGLSESSLLLACAIILLLGTVITMLLFSIGITVRRLHDGKYGGWSLLMSLIPIAGPIWLLDKMLTKGEGSNPNKWKRADTGITIALSLFGAIAFLVLVLLLD